MAARDNVFMKFFKLMLAVEALFFLTFCSPQKKIVVNKEIFRSLDKKSDRDYSEEKYFVVITPKNDAEFESLQREVSHLAHESGKCGGYSLLDANEIEEVEFTLEKQRKLNEGFELENYRAPTFKQEIADLNAQVSKEKVRESIDLLVSQKTRSAKSSEPNKAISAFEEHIKKTLKKSKLSFKLEQLQHKSTEQNSLKLRIAGSEEGGEVVILGGHIDSVNSSWFSKEAPGADDNASGSSVILEAIRVLLESGFKPKKNIEIFWYAAEEQGLLGSKEIAKSYKENEIPVVAVMQLDMVLYPGNGDVVGLTTDYTNVELTKQIEDLSALYLDTPVERFRCGYGCSDHASWHQNGFKTVFPFESTFRTSNKSIHSANDVISPSSSLEHALKFSKIALSFLVEFSSK